MRRAARSHSVVFASVFAALLAACFVGTGGIMRPSPVAAQEFDTSVISDTLFNTTVRNPANYLTSYAHDKSNRAWTQTLDYDRSWNKLVTSVNGMLMTQEAALSFGSQSTNGDISANLMWLAKQRLILTLAGRHSMSAIADGDGESRSEQRRNELSFQGQYLIPRIWKAQLTLTGSSAFQRNYDLRTAERLTHQSDPQPDSISVESDSSFASGRLDAVRGRLDWPLVRGVTFLGSVYGSRQRPVTTVRRFRATEPIDGTAGVDSIDVRRIQLPTDNAFLSGTLTVERLRATKFVLESSRTGGDQVYFDLGQLKVEQYSSDGQSHTFHAEGAPVRGLTFNADASLKRSLKEYVARPNWNALVTTRQAMGTIGYNTPATTAAVSFVLNRTRAEQQATSNGITLTRSLSTNLRQRTLGRLWLAGIGTATLTSFRYLFTPKASDPERTFSEDDRDVASAFGSIGAQFAVTPRCSTAATFSVSRSHNVALDALQSGGNLATTVYQLNGSIRLPLHPDLSIGQDYILTANSRVFDYNEDQDGLSRNFRIETLVIGTPFPLATFRMDHRYYFFDQGEFSPLVPGGDRLYGVSVEQAQQTLEGTIGVRPLTGVTLDVRQAFTDFENRDLVGGSRQRTGLWSLGLGLSVARTFRGGAKLTGVVRREDSYQNRNGAASIRTGTYWLSNVTFQAQF